MSTPGPPIRPGRWSASTKRARNSGTTSARRGCRFPATSPRRTASTPVTAAPTCFLWCAPHLGWREVAVTRQRTAIDWAHAMRALVDVHFPQAERIVLVLDNLNTHTPGALYQAFPPAEAKRIWDTLELHYTPKHGSWLNMAELELSALARQCLRRRIPDAATLAAEVAAWVTRRNAAGVRLHWTFTSADARTKLSHLYPVPQPDI